MAEIIRRVSVPPLPSLPLTNDFAVAAAAAATVAWPSIPPHLSYPRKFQTHIVIISELLKYH
ncbi:unnamed protein product [Onchocerca flexuosa]|uniref:Uncharacterized protein n=1 Tax=Onchocerca flexuosa TaxID=387005 RepID=A0A183HS99_9BILA|nr:unnamed protein product [Onchocerca flexuosa]